jgi:hypothetical protein
MGEGAATLMELRNILQWGTVDYVSVFKNNPICLITLDDYLFLFPGDTEMEILDGALIDVLQFIETNPAKVKMLLLFSINRMLYYGDTKELLGMDDIYKKFTLVELIGKYNVLDVLMHLYEIMIYPAFYNFLLITNLTDELPILYLYKNKNVLIPGYWEKIYDNFQVAAAIEEMQINYHCRSANENNIHYWLFYLITRDRCLSLHTVAGFIASSGFYNASISYEKLKSLCINQMYGGMNRRRIIEKEEDEVALPKRKRMVKKEEEEDEEEDDNEETSPCVLCKNNETCLVNGCDKVFGVPGFEVCRYGNGGFHGCKIHDTALNKEAKNDSVKQQLIIRSTDFLKQLLSLDETTETITMQGFRMDHKLFRVNGKLVNTLGTRCVSEIPKLNGELSVSIRVYLYNYTFFTIGVVTNMNIERGNKNQIEMIEESSLHPFSIRTQPYLEVLLENNVKMTFNFSFTYMIIDGVESTIKSTALRIYKAWKCDPNPSPPFNQEVRDDYFIIIIGTRKNTKKYKAIKIFFN